MQIYYFSRTGRSREIAGQLAERYHTAAMEIRDHRNWNGKANYLKAAMMAMAGKSVPAEYTAPDLKDDIIVVFPLWAGSVPPGVRTFAEEVGRGNITAVVTSLGSRLKDRSGFKRVIDVVGKDIEAPVLPEAEDGENRIPVLHCSICNGEQVAGFKDAKTGKFEEVMLIRNNEDLQAFMKQYGISRITREY